MDLKKRVNKFAKHLEKNDIDAVIIINPSTIRYFTDFLMNQVAHSIVVIEQDSTISYLVPKLDYDRAIRDCWIENIYSYAEDTPDYLSPLKKLVNKKWDVLGIETSFITNQHLSYIEDIFKGKLTSIDFLVEQLMKIKTEAEITLIKKSAHIATEVMDEVMKYIVQNERVTEREATGYAQYLMGKAGAENYSFQPFMMSGIDSALPRRASTTKELKKNELIVFDMGCIYKGYCSDITRTFLIGEPTKKQQEIYDIAARAQQLAIEAIKPGQTANEIDAVARDYITAHGYGDYFPHLTGHGLGLNIHEYPIIDQGENAVLRENMVVTMEPGIYFPDVGAVRIEDMILVTENGFEYLTHSPRNLILQ